jgi:undecaprenyl-phosphate 4-deoxy-4-formamido-L-arabinose transferase
MPELSVVIPVYNAASTISKLYRELIPVLETEADRFEVIMVEDHGADDSWERIQEFALNDPRVRGIRLSRNFGQHNALLCGIRSARYAMTVTMDDDLQHQPAEIPKLLQKVAEGYDVVYGTPERKAQTGVRVLVSKWTRHGLRLGGGIQAAPYLTSFRAFPTRLREAFANYGGPVVSIDALLSWAASNFAAVPIDHAPRAGGESNYNVLKLLRHGLNILTGYTTVPLRLASLMGFALTAFGLAILVWAVGHYFISGSTVPGFTFLASLVSIFSGAQLFALGVLGEYLGQVHWRSMTRPTYVVQAECGVASDPATVD